jgi:hypothetical protein
VPAADGSVHVLNPATGAPGTSLPVTTGTVSSPVVGADQGYVSTIAIAARVRACVLVLDPPGQAIATTATDTGGYVVEGVPAGRWNVEFVPDDGCMGNDTADAFQY